MTDSDQTWKTRIHLLIAHPQRPALLVGSTGGQLALPSVIVDDLIWWRNAEVVNREVSRALGQRLSVLHCLSRDDDHDGRRSERVYLLEYLDEPSEASGVWCGDRELAKVSFGNDGHRKMAEAVMGELDGSAEPDLRPPWSRPGWLLGAKDWFEEQLDDLGLVREQPVQLIYSWPLAAVLHAETSSGEIYMKASSFLPGYVDEPGFTTHLSRFFPDEVPRPIRTNTQTRWMLLPDLGYPIREPSVDVAVDALTAFCDLQVRSIEHVDELRRLGCPDRGLEALSTQADLLAASSPTELGLCDDEIDSLRRIVPHIRSNIERLSKFGLPLVLSHGDLFTGNIARVDGRFVFFDWALMSLSHPLIDLVNFVQDEKLPIGPDAFMGPWIGFESMDRLCEAWRLAWPLSYLKFSMDNGLWSRYLKPEPEEFPECQTQNLRALIACFAD